VLNRKGAKVQRAQGKARKGKRHSEKTKLDICVKPSQRKRDFHPGILGFLRVPFASFAPLR